MKSWFGIIVFLAMVILNIVLENQKKARLEREEGESDDQKLPPPGPGGFPKKDTRSAHTLDRPAPEPPATSPENASLQDLMQEIFQREDETAPKPPPTLEENTAFPTAAEPAAKAVALPVPMPLAAETPATPVKPPSGPQSSPPACSPVRQHQAVAIPRGRQGLRQAIVMAEVLGKPKALQ